jgi:hypothetical protein
VVSLASNALNAQPYNCYKKRHLLKKEAGFAAFGYI